MKRMLITGAGGFIGKRTVAAALRDTPCEIHAVVSGAHRHDFPAEVHVHETNLLDADACARLMRRAGPDVLLHLAWPLARREYSNADSNLVWLEHSMRLLRQFFESGGKRFIFASSASGYGEHAGRLMERGTSVRRSVYGECKLAFERVCENYCSKNGLEFVSARCFPVYGEGDGRSFKALPAAISAFCDGQPFLCKGPNNIWDYVHVDDAGAALVQTAMSGYCGPVNIGTGRPHLIRDVFSAVADKMSCRHLLSFEDNTGDVTIQVADPTVLNQVIGYRCKVSFDEGLDRTIAWWRAQKQATPDN